MRYLLAAIIPGSLIAGAIVAVSKLIATGSVTGLFHGGWLTALNVVGWTAIIGLAFWFRARDPRRRAAADALRRTAPTVHDPWRDVR